MICRGCENSRKHGDDGVYCQLFGIFLNGGHLGCKYFTEKDEGNATAGNRDGLDDSEDAEQ